MITSKWYTQPIASMSWICSPKLAKDNFSHFQEISKTRKPTPSLIIRETSILLSQRGWSEGIGQQVGL